MNGYYINLEHRTDRNKHFIENIQKYLGSLRSSATTRHLRVVAKKVNS